MMMIEPFEKAELLNELDDDFEFLSESYGMFVEDAADLLKQLDAAITAGDCDAVASAAHTLKSMVGNFCARPAHSAALELETLGRSGELSEGAGKLEKLRFEIERLQRALDDLIQHSS